MIFSKSYSTYFSIVGASVSIASIDFGRSNFIGESMAEVGLASYSDVRSDCSLNFSLSRAGLTLGGNMLAITSLCR